MLSCHSPYCSGVLVFRHCRSRSLLRFMRTSGRMSITNRGARRLSFRNQVNSFKAACSCIRYRSELIRAIQPTVQSSQTTDNALEPRRRPVDCLSGVDVHCSACTLLHRWEAAPVLASSGRPNKCDIPTSLTQQESVRPGPESWCQ